MQLIVEMASDGIEIKHSFGLCIAYGMMYFIQDIAISLYSLYFSLYLNINMITLIYIDD